MVENIKTGDRVEITPNRSSVAKKSYISQVDRIESNGYIVMMMPISYGQLVKLPTSEEYNFLVFTEAGLISFTGKVQKYTKEDDLNFMTVMVLTNAIKDQRRDFFRFGILLPVIFTVIDENVQDESELDNEVKYDGIIKDLGGGGLRFVSIYDISQSSKIKMIMMLNEDPLVILGSIMRKQFFPKSNYRYQYGIKFIGLPNADKEKIIKYTFAEQRKYLQITNGRH